MKSVILVADIGTSSLKSALINEDGALLAFCRYRFANTKNPSAWISAFEESVPQLLRDASNAHDDFDAKNVLGICISGNGPTLASKNFLHLWNAPNGTQEQMARYQELSSQSLFLPRILYLKECHAELFDNAEMIFSGPEFMVHYLTGAAVTILPDERFKTAYWTNEQLDNLKIPRQKLPAFCKTTDNCGTLKPSIAQKLCLCNNVKVFAGAPDFVAALLGTATVTPGCFCDRAGTSEGLNVCTAHQLKNAHPMVRVLPSCINPLWNASVLLPESGKKFSIYKKNSEFANVSYQETTTRILKNPSIYKEGFCLMQEIAESLKNALAILQDATGYHAKSIRLTGGQAYNDEWNQFKTNCLGVPLEVTQFRDGELLGDAITALTGLGHYGNLAEAACNLVKIAKTYYPA